MLAEFRTREALISPYGPPEAGVAVVQAFEPLDVEYAAVRRSCGLLDLPQRGTIEVRGGERQEFLNRMLTQELKGVGPYASVRAFWLSRQGRIDGDLRVMVLEDRVLIDVDVFAAARVVQTLSAYVIAEDVEIVDRTEEFHRLALHGPAARAAIERCSTHVRGSSVGGVEAGRVAVLRVGEAEVIVDRDDTAGEMGLELLVSAKSAAAVYAEILRAGGFEHNPTGPLGFTPTRGEGVGSAIVRPVGWGAYNVARVEAGTPYCFLDFGPTNLPHESGVIESRVSFTKGCYLGQEIVARVHNLGQPKQRLVGLRLPGPAQGDVGAVDATRDFELPLVAQPVTGAAVFAAASGVGAGSRAASLGEPIGSVASSVVSPMLGGAPVCFAMVKSKHAAPGERVLVECDGTMLTGTVQARLKFWARPPG